MANRSWSTAMRSDFALAVFEILKDWKMGDLDAEEAMAKVSYGYVDTLEAALSFYAKRENYPLAIGSLSTFKVGVDTGTKARETLDKGK